MEITARGQKWEPIKILPREFQTEFRARHHRPTEAEMLQGSYRVVWMKITPGNSAWGQRITVMVVDESGLPLPLVPVAFSYSSYPEVYTLSDQFRWSPSFDLTADVLLTDGGGTCDEVQGDVIQKGQPGGMTVSVLDPLWPSEWVTGLGMLAEHEGVFMVYQLRRDGILSIFDQLDQLNLAVFPEGALALAAKVEVMDAELQNLRGRVEAIERLV